MNTSMLVHIIYYTTIWTFITYLFSYMIVLVSNSSHTDNYFYT